MDGYEAIAIRITNAENNFVNAVIEQFEKSKEEAEIILSIFKSKKAIKIDAITGQFQLVHGALWDLEVMNTALEMANVN